MEEPRRKIDAIKAAEAALAESRLYSINGYRALERKRIRKMTFAERVRDRLRNNRKRPPESGMPAPVEPPKGPLPKQGGAAVSLDFD